MGDGADMALDAAWEDWEQKEDWIANGSDPNEGYELGIVDELGKEIGDSKLPDYDYTKSHKNPSKYKKDGSGRKKYTYECKHCGKKGLQWKEIDGKWRLHDRKLILHVCKEYLKGKKDDSV